MPLSASLRRASVRRAVAVVAAALLVSVLPVTVSTSASALPVSVDLRAHAVPAGDQGATSGCVGWAVGYALLGWQSRRDGYAGQPFAPMYLYSQINGGVDTGSEIDDALEVLKTQGIDTWEHYGPGPQDWRTQPTTSERAHARTWRIGDHAKLFATTAGASGAAAIRASLAASRPVVITLVERPGFDGLTGTAIDLDTTGPAVGNHVVLALGYDADSLIVQNSFGTRWGDKGFGRLGWNVVEKDVSEAYTIDGFLLDPARGDITPPKVTVPYARVHTGARLTRSGGVPYEVGFTAADAAGIASTRLYRQVDGGGWHGVKLPTGTARKVVLTLTPGHRYRFAATATDRRGNSRARVLGPTLRVRSLSERGAGVTYAKRWSTVSSSSAVGGKLRTTSASGAAVSVRFTGRAIAWYAAQGPTRSSAKVYVDGRLADTVSLHRAGSRARVAVWRASLAPGRHTVKIVVKKSGSRRSIDVDGFVVTS